MIWSLKRIKLLLTLGRTRGGGGGVVATPSKVFLIFQT